MKLWIVRNQGYDKNDQKGIFIDFWKFKSF